MKIIRNIILVILIRMKAISPVEVMIIIIIIIKVIIIIIIIITDQLIRFDENYKTITEVVLGNNNKIINNMDKNISDYNSDNYSNLDISEYDFIGRSQRL